MRNIDHLESLIGSINKMVENAKNKAVIRSREIYLLNLIYKLIKSNCSDELSEDNKKLLNLYYKLFSRYNFLCRAILSRDYYLNNINTNQTYINSNNNTAPEIDDPIPVEPTPVPQPTICEIEITYNSRLEFIWLEKNDFTKCYVGQSPIKFLKIISLPENGALQINDANAFIGQTIDINTLNNNNIFIKYQTFLQVEEQDTFQVQVSDSSTTPVYSETTNINIIVI